MGPCFSKSPCKCRSRHWWCTGASPTDDLAKKSKAGRFGTLIRFTLLGAGVVGFIIKTILVEVMNF